MGARDHHKPCTRTNSTHHTQEHHDTTHRHHIGSCRQQDYRQSPVGSIRPPHTMAPGRSKSRHQDTTITIHQDITQQASHSKAQAVAAASVFMNGRHHGQVSKMIQKPYQKMTKKRIKNEGLGDSGATLGHDVARKGWSF